MDRVRQPKTPTKLVPVMREADTSKVLDACRGKGFASLRDEALIQLYANTGARLQVLPDEAAETIAPHHPSAGHRHWQMRRPERWRLSQRAVRAMRVVMVDIVGEHRLEMTTSEDQHPVE